MKIKNKLHSFLAKIFIGLSFLMLLPAPSQALTMSDLQTGCKLVRNNCQNLYTEYQTFTASNSLQNKMFGAIFAVSSTVGMVTGLAAIKALQASSSGLYHAGKFGLKHTSRGAYQLGKFGFEHAGRGAYRLGKFGFEHASYGAYQLKKYGTNHLQNGLNELENRFSYMLSLY